MCLRCGVELENFEHRQRRWKAACIRVQTDLASSLVNPPVASTPNIASDHGDAPLESQFQLSEEHASTAKEGRYARVGELLTKWACVKNISVATFDHVSFRDAIARLSQGEFQFSSYCFREQVVRLRNVTCQRISETHCGPSVTLMTDGGTVEKRKFWPVILYTSSRLYFCFLNRVQKDSAATLWLRSSEGKSTRSGIETSASSPRRQTMHRI
jgi:hypothetical protein